jgi:hypothetical protein
MYESSRASLEAEGQRGKAGTTEIEGFLSDRNTG